MPFLFNMKFWVKVWLILIPLLVSAGPPPAVTQATVSLLPDLVEKVGGGVVNISSTKFIKPFRFYGPGSEDLFMRFFGLTPEATEKQSSLGSGFLIDQDGFILTNHHVVAEADEIMIIFADKRKLPAKVVGRDRALDLALLQLKRKEGVLRPVVLGNSESVRIGESVFAIGNPFGLQHTVTAGIISAKNRTIGLGAYDRFLQTDCSINFGNSGGPLFNFKGEVIGINTAINPQGQGLGFAIPISEAQSHVEEFKKFGRVIRPWLGLLGQEISPALQYHYGLPVDYGVVITNLVRRGPAQAAGLELGDILLVVQGQKIKEMNDLQRQLVQLKPGQEIVIQLMRGRRTIEKKIHLKSAPDLDEIRGLPEGIL